jgi:mono/diheme cytochrome c family protein
MRTVLILALWCGWAAGFAACPTVARAEDKPVTYEAHVAAILKKRCGTCHGDTKQESGLSLTSYAGLMKGGGGGPVVVAGRSSASRLLEVVTSTEDGERMPPDGERLPDDQIAVIRKWIDTGLRENAGSSVARQRTLGFLPSAASSSTAPGAVPANLESFSRPATRRGFPVLSLAASPRAAVAAAANYGAIELFDPATRVPLGSVAFPEGEPLALSFSRSGRLLLAAGGRPVQSGSVVLFDVATGKRLASVAEEPDAILSADLSPDEKRIAIGCTSRLVKVYSTEDGGLVATIDKHTDWVTSVAYSPNGKFLTTGDRGGSVHLWDAANAGAILPLAEHKKSVRGLTWRSDSGVVASCGEDGTVVWWDAKDGWPLVKKSNAHGGGVFDCRFGPNGELATCGRDGLVRLWSADGNERKQFSLDSATPPASQPPAGVKRFPIRVAISGDGKSLLAGDTTGQIHRWEID